MVRTREPRLGAAECNGGDEREEVRDARCERGPRQQAKGKLKEMAGKVTGNEEQEAEGQVDQAEGKGQEAMGKAKELGKEAKRRVTGEDKAA